MIKYLLLILTLLLSTNYALGCSQRYSPTPDFDSTFYVFIGEVVGIDESVNFKLGETKRDAVGLKIKVSENIYSPKSTSYYEVFPMRLAANCTLMSDTKEVRELYPIGSQVRVVAKEATNFNFNPASSIIQLIIISISKGSISRNDLMGNRDTSAKTIYDYKGFVFNDYTNTEEQALVISNNRLPEFELRKDLFRLKEAKTEQDRTKILERLVFYPYVNKFTFEDYASNYLENKDKAQLLIKQWDERVKEFYSKPRRY